MRARRWNEGNAPQFRENILSLGAAYGLSVQGLGSARIKSNLLPPELARIAMWKKKRPWFAAAAAVAAVGALMPYARTSMDMAALASNSNEGDQAAAIILASAGLAFSLFLPEAGLLNAAVIMPA